MNIIHVVFARKAQTKMTVIADIVSQLAIEQTKLGHTVTVWEIGSKPLDQLQHKGFHTKSFTKKLLPWRTTALIKSAIDTIQPNTIVHIHGGIIPAFYSLAFYLYEKGIPYILTPHGRYHSYSLQKAGYLKRQYFLNFDVNIITWASALHFSSNYEQQSLSQFVEFNTQKSYIKPNGLLNTQLHIAPKILKHDEIIYCFNGELNMEEMGLDILLKAFADFKKLHKNNAVLWIIGNGKDRNTILKWIKKYNLHKYVFVKPAVFGALKFEQLSHIDVMIRPSRLDYSPAVLIEAAAMSIPIMVSSETGLAELVEQCNAGYILKELTVSAMVEQFKQSMVDIDTVHWNRKKMNAHQMIVEHFAWNAIAQSHVDVYKSVLNNQ